MPIITTQLRIGRKGGDQWLLPIQLCVLDTNAHKLILGMDILSPLKFIYNDPSSRMHFENKGFYFSLPVVTHEYSFRLRAVLEYNKAIPAEVQASEVEIATTKLTTLDEIQEEAMASTLDEVAYNYVGKNLVDVLCWEKEVLPDQVEEPISQVLGNISITLARHLFAQSVFKIDMQIVVTEVVD